MKSFFALCAVALSLQAAPIKLLIVDGQNNHNWRAMTPFMKAQLEKSTLFTVDVSTSPASEPKGATPEIKKQFAAQWESWKPDFSKYQVVISNYNGDDWPKSLKESFERYMSGGGRFVCVHAADNSFPEWKAYNQMIGLGGWGGRTERHGPYVYYDDAGKQIRDTSKGSGGSHGPQHEFTIQIRNENHPITKGMPTLWKHAQDELYDSLRGPAENMEVLASAWCAKTKRHEPMMMVIRQDKGITFHTPMGHENGKALQCVGFITTLNRACEWLATGKVTQPIPVDFPKADKVSTRN